MDSFDKPAKTESTDINSRKADDIRRAEEEIHSADPLDDKAFKKFIESDYWFTQVAELILGRPLSDGQLVGIQNEMALSVNGKLIRMDNLRSTAAEVINLEAQSKASEFPYKRHLFYGAMAYVFTLKEGGKYQDLKPTVSIVLYKNKGSAGLLESAQMQGTLIHSPAEQDLLTLIAVNAKKWRDAANNELRQLLAVMSNGVYNEHNSPDFADVETNSESFKKLNDAVRVAVAEVRYHFFKEGGNSEMERVMKSFLTEAEKREIEERVKKETALALLKKGVDAKTVAEVLNISLERLQELKKEEQM